MTHLLQQGDNAIGIHLGEGWYCGEIGWGLHGKERNHYGDTPYALAQLVLTLDDGSTQCVPTDKTWCGGPSAIVTSDFLMGETHDARREAALDGWSDPGFDDSAWRHVGIMDLDTWGEVPLVARPAPAVVKWGELEPVSVTPRPDGTTIFDLGQDMVGYARLRVRGDAGQTVILRFGEMLNADGSLYTTNLRRARATDQYTLKGGGEEVWEPKFTFHGFRYVEVSGLIGEASTDTITGIVLTSDTPDAGTFFCSHNLVNQIHSNVVWSQRGNFLEVPTDCPQRDERLGWLGDAQIFARTATFNADVAAFFAKWGDDLIDAQSPEGAFPNVAPRIIDVADGAPAWGDAGVIVPIVMYDVYGHRPTLAHQYPSMTRWIDLLHRANPDHLWRERVNANFGDWLSVNADAQKDVVSTAFYAHSTALVARAATILEHNDDARKYHALAVDIRDPFHKAFVAEDVTIQGGTQTAYVLALAFDLLPEPQRPAAARHLVDNIEAHDDHLTTGFLGVGHLLPTLARFGHADTAARLLLNDTFPSWGYSIRHGATTIWERWNGYTDTDGFFNPDMNSFNHYSLGSVDEYLYRFVAGIDTHPSHPEQSGYQHILLHPHIPPGITHATSTHPSIRGPIVSHWQLKNNPLHWHIAIPPTATATARLPSDVDPASIRLNTQPVSGTPVTTATGTTALEIDLDPGTYDLVAPLPRK